MILLTKLITVLIYPLTQALLAMIASVVLFQSGKLRVARVLLLSSLVWLWLWSMPLVGEAIVRSLESRYPPAAANDMPEADAILVLGGCVEVPRSPRVDPDLTGTADRLWYAARLYHAGRAPRIVASGGSLPWLQEPMSEAEAMRTVLVDFGVPLRAIELESASANTRENMQRSREVLDRLDAHRVLLVTSASHMRRALAEASQAGIDAVPAAADYTAGERRLTVLDLLPDAFALHRSSSAIKEYAGCLLVRGCL